jgi:hypothetical protein
MNFFSSMLSLYSLLKAGLLFMNALAVLHPGRFLRRHGLEQPDFSESGVKASISQTLAWTRGLRGASPTPLFFARGGHVCAALRAATSNSLLCAHPGPFAVFLIITNCLVIVVEVLFG